MSNRRLFLKQSALSIGATLASGSLLKAEGLTAKKSGIEIKENDTILFQGDSITDASRKRDTALPNDIAGMGRGYALIAASVLLNKFAEKNLKIYNRGISGNKVPQLDARWQTDCLDLKPNILSILVGVNDYWHKRNGKYEGSAESYHEQYRKLLDRTLQEFPHVKLIIGEPFGVKNVKHVDDSWFPEFAQYQQAARDIAKEYKAIFIPYQSIFDEAEKRNSGAYWTSDGVHYTLAGANLMAESWLATVK